ncbi:ABC transporter ATP-binding protein [Roseibium marinum]|uniref:sn-glycerol 3-phosphate transport system ATP-binding protein/multiple sugar transport system ATP-binding protein n=1 Tax=Roseibium marinum TaxID=281252 RepID=A0A2S3UN45_9HYPH|nr:sn-glycerol-3-phosphate ABC transporter ATP-binding protein UgpC [Roseibium marinum]POF28919.1 sn-glycerol 3-phosphate transport system ATP-binding protein/multiple sugar transport system ATP-binding protein [Roseibium marinum]
MSEIKLNKVSRDYGLGIFGVRDVSLEIEEGEFMVLLGPSGCGKSTTLRMIAGLEETTDGQISIAGRDVTRLAPRHRNVAVVFQSYALYPHMSVRENMRFGMKMRKTPRDEQDRRIAQAASVLGLQPYLDRKPSALSGGQRQRVALGRAIVREPDVFLMDEPLSNLDAKLRGEMRQELVKLHRRVGKTTVFVTHDHVEAMTMGDRICIMRNGRVEQVGVPLEVYARPRNTFVAQFLATPAMNLIEAQLNAEGEAVMLSAGPIAGPLPEREAALYRAAVERKLLFGLRAEDIVTQPRPGAQAFQGIVTVLEALGPENLIVVETAGQSVSARVDRHFLPRIGDEVTLYADLAHTHLFDAASGDAIAREV